MNTTATVTPHPSAWPTEMNENMDLAQNGTTTGTEAERTRSEETLRTAIAAYLETHEGWELEDLANELAS